MSEVFLFTVAEAFQLSGRPGPVLVPGVPCTVSLKGFKVGSLLRLQTPDGQSINTHLAGVEFLSYGARPVPVDRPVPIALPSTVSRSQVPPGTKVFAVFAD